VSDNKVSVEITLEEKAALKALTQLTREVNKTEQSFQKMGATGDESVGVVTDAAGGLKEGLGGLVKGVTVANLASQAILGTANAVKTFVLESVNAAIEAEESQARLAQALRATGSFSEEAMADFNGYATAIAHVSVYSDDAVLSQVAVAKSMGATNQQAKNLVRAAIELSATFGGSLEERVMQLGKTLTGTGGKLAQLVPNFKDLTTEQLRNGEAIDLINSKYSGAAQSQLETYGGKLNQLKKAYGELQESLGGIVVESGAANSFINASKLVDLLTKSIQENRIEAKRAEGGFVETSESLKQLEGKYRDLWIQAQEAKEIINNPSFFDQLLARPLAAADNLKLLNEQMAETKALIDAAKPQVDANKAASDTAGSGVNALDQATVDSRKQANLLLQQAEIEQAAWEAEQDQAQREITAENYQAEIDQLVGIEQAKLDIKYEIEAQKAQLIEDSVTKELTLRKIASDKALASEQAELAARKKIGDQQLKFEQMKQQAIVGVVADAFQQAANVAKDGTAAQFVLQKAAALAQIYMADAQARAMIPIQTALIPDPTPGQVIRLASMAELEAIVTAKTAIGVAGVAASMLRFADGGIVPGYSYTGDKVHAMVNSGEMILNQGQQAELFELANNGGKGGNSLSEKIDALIYALVNQPNQLVVDGRVLATVIRKEVQSGFKLA
jgi:hypothetical protein